MRPLRTPWLLYKWEIEQYRINLNKLVYIHYNIKLSINSTPKKNLGNGDYFCPIFDCISVENDPLMLQLEEKNHQSL